MCLECVCGEMRVGSVFIGFCCRINLSKCMLGLVGLGQTYLLVVCYRTLFNCNRVLYITMQTMLYPQGGLECAGAPIGAESTYLKHKRPCLCWVHFGSRVEQIWKSYSESVCMVNHSLKI